jgi:hypothetical protein
MLQELLALLPKLGMVALVSAVVGALAGAGLWLMGARISRSLITLLLVSAGATLGLQLPRWFNWPIDAWAPALGVGSILGVSGFVLHRFWVGVGLGAVLAVWAAVATWAVWHGTQPWGFPAWQEGMHVHLYLQSIWTSLPIEVSRPLPFACGAAFVVGLAASLLWPRVGLSLLYSGAGVTLLVGLGLMAVKLGKPAWLEKIPAEAPKQIATLFGMVLFGTLIQWRLTPAMSKQKPVQLDKAPGPKPTPEPVGGP